MSYDYESYNSPITGGEDNFQFSDKTIRHNFIKKVYLILVAQLTITFGFVAIFTFNDDAKVYVSKNMWLFWIALVMTFVFLIALTCCGDVRRKFPTNFILLGLFTVCEGFLLGLAAAAYTAEEVFMAVGITAVVVLALTAFAFQTKYDFTMCGGFVLVSIVILMLFGLLAMIFQNKVLSIVYSSVAALLFSFYLVYDTQMIMGGSHKYSISPEEYVFAALTLYLDIINLFLQILSLIGAARD